MKNLLVAAKNQSKRFYSVSISTLLCTLLISCSKKDEPFCVVYEVSVQTRKNIETEIFIAYSDSTGYHKLTTKDKKWSKEIRLPQKEIIATLIAFPSLSTNLLLDEDDIIINGRITYRDKTVEVSDKKIVTLHYTRPIAIFGF